MADVEETLIVKELRAEKFGLATTPSATGTTINCTNWSNDVALDCNTGADAEICDVLATLIKALQAKGIIGGSVTA